MKWVAVALLLIIIMGVSGALFVRVAPSEPEQWHVDPTEITPPAAPNFSLLRGEDAPTFNARTPAVATALEAVILAEPNTTLLAGSAAIERMTFIQRSPIMAFPDYITVKVEPYRNGSRLAIYSRSRFGYSDLGVNGARVERIVEALKRELGEQ